MKEFKPAFRFLAVFLGLYLGLNIIYGLWISAYQNQPDPATRLVTEQTSWLLNLFGEETQTQPRDGSPTVSILKDSRVALSVFEGCNSINVMIVFVAFLFAFKGSWKSMAWFLPLGLALIYIANLVRVILLFYVAEYGGNISHTSISIYLQQLFYLIVFILCGGGSAR